eukprot:gene3773-1291_t
MVPLDVGDPAQLAAALEHVRSMLRNPPFTPAGVLPEGCFGADIAYV